MIVGIEEKDENSHSVFDLPKRLGRLGWMLRQVAGNRKNRQRMKTTINLAFIYIRAKDDNGREEMDFDSSDVKALRSMTRRTISRGTWGPFCNQLVKLNSRVGASVKRYRGFSLGVDIL